MLFLQGLSRDPGPCLHPSPPELALGAGRPHSEGSTVSAGQVCGPGRGTARGRNGSGTEGREREEGEGRILGIGEAENRGESWDLRWGRVDERSYTLEQERKETDSLSV